MGKTQSTFHRSRHQRKMKQRPLEHNGIPAQVAKLLRDYPVGVHCTTLAKRLKCGDRAVTEAMRKLKARDLAVSLPDPCGKSNNRPRWCAPGRLEAMREDIKRNRVPLKKELSLSPARLEGEAVVTARTKFTTKQNFTARPRHYVETPEPFFSAMSPGSYLQEDTAIARAYPTP